MPGISHDVDSLRGAVGSDHDPHRDDGLVHALGALPRLVQLGLRGPRGPFPAFETRHPSCVRSSRLSSETSGRAPF
jgi:hypothetical protein